MCLYCRQTHAIIANGWHASYQHSALGMSALDSIFGSQHKHQLVSTLNTMVGSGRNVDWQHTSGHVCDTVSSIGQYLALIDHPDTVPTLAQHSLAQH